MNARSVSPRGIAAACLLIGALAPATAFADVGFAVDASTLRFIYTKGAGGPGSIGRIDITSTASSSVTVQQLELGADRLFGGSDDTIVDLAQIGNGAFNTVFSADVFQLGVNDYAIVGTTVLGDVGNPVKIMGDFNSTFVTQAGNALFFGGDLSNPDGVLRPGSPNTDWVYQGNPALTPDVINGHFGGMDGADGSVTLLGRRSEIKYANLFEFHFIGSFPDLDAFFNTAVQASTLANLQINMTVVPAPGAALLGMIGLSLVGWVRRRIR